MKAWNEYVGSTNPILNIDYKFYNFSYGDVGTFVLDSRSHRDCVKKIMLGKEQKAILKNWMINDKSIFKFIISSVSFCHNIRNPDTWWAFNEERNEIKDFIEKEKIKGVTFLTADLHATALIKILPGVYEITTSPIDSFVMPSLVEYSFDDKDQILYYTEVERSFSKISINTLNDTKYWMLEVINHNVTDLKATFNLNENGKFDMNIIYQNPIVKKKLK